MPTATATAKPKKPQPTEAAKDLTARVAAAQLDAEKAAHEVVERMFAEGRNQPASHELAVFRAARWDEKNAIGKELWRAQLGVERVRDEIRERIGSAEERQQERDNLAGCKAKYEAKAGAIKEQIEKLQTQLTDLQNAVDDAQAVVDWRNSYVHRAQDKKLLPMHLAGSISREISQLKRTAAGEEWWPMQGRVQRIESLLQYDPTSAEDCAKMESTIRAEVPGAVRNRAERQPVTGEATWMALTFDHPKIVAWFVTLREELKTKKPLVEAGRERLALAIAEVEAQANEYFLTDNERRLAAKK